MLQTKAPRNKGKKNVQGVPQTQIAALPRHQQEEETDKTKQVLTSLSAKDSDQPARMQRVVVEESTRRKGVQHKLLRSFPRNNHLMGKYGIFCQ